MADCFPTSTAAAPKSVVEVLRKLQSYGFCTDLELSGEFVTGGEEEAGFFDRVLLRFFVESHKRGGSPPIPALLGDGRSIDLFRLYSVVQDKGGYDLVSESSRWKFVAEDIGFDSGFGSSLKLVFYKYLSGLELWLERISAEKLCRRVECENLPRLADNCVRGEVRDDKEDGHFTPQSSLKKEQFLSPERGIERRLDFENGEIGDQCEMNLVKSETNGSVIHHKRKRDDVVGLLNWVKMVAKNPCDVSLKNVVSSNKGKAKSNATSDLFAQALLFRKTMFLKKTRRIANDSHMQNGGLLDSRTDCNQNLQAASKQVTLGTCSTLKVANHFMDSSLLAARVGSEAKQKLRSSGFNFDQLADWLFGNQQRVRVPVGSHFQAKVPAWSGKPSLPSTDPDDLKWLGTKTWPCENGKKMSILVYSLIGRGRSDNCQCGQPASVQCIRFHIAENRLQLSRELGPTFYSWGFNRMGEEVALSWTEEEEQKFKAIVRSYRPSLNKNYWDQLPLCFPSKGRIKLVSYYYNVFLLRRRSYQNRVTPNKIDSDDEDSEFGFLSNPFGLGAVMARETNSLVCAQNSQCIDLGD